MATISVTPKHLVVTCGDKAFAVELETGGKKLVLEPPNLQGQKADNAEESRETENNAAEAPETESVKNFPVGKPAQVVLASFSACSSRLVLCSNNKQLSLWNTSDWSLISNRCIARTASAVKFTPSGRSILVADKSGDAYTYSTQSPNDKGILIHGHLSMLLDILVTPDEEYIITCDRDEKIRVSHFPNSYNIHTYCLGHDQFVSTIALLPHNPKVLISSSGDGTMKLWDYMSGISNLVINCSDDLNGSNLAPVIDSSTEQTEATPVKCFTSCQIEDDTSTVVASMAGFSGCLVYSIKGRSENATSSSLIQILSLDSEPLSLALTESKHLWLLSPSNKDVVSVLIFSEPTAKFVFDCSLLDTKTSLAVEFVTDRKDMFGCVDVPCSMKALYKRKYDNLQVYHERKKLRTLTTVS